MSLTLSTLKLDLPPQITTNRLVLQRFLLSDAEEVFYGYASLPEVARFMSWPCHRTLDDSRAFLKYAVAAWDDGTDYSYAVRLKEGGPLIGSFGLMHADGRVQFGYSLAPRYWNRGYATEIVSAMMGMVRVLPGLYRIGTYVDVENVASMRVLEKAGLVREARLPRWQRFVNQGNQPRDCVLYRLDLD